jgi:hypothetical protein
MTAVHNLGLPASERAKLEPARAKGAALPAHVDRAVPEPAPPAVVRAPRPADHLSGFARA